jgi:protein-L-isoaspartate(D-aspartate) O-methyltransferase
LRRATVEQARQFFARQMAAASGSHDPRLERIFALVPREAFLPPGPWQIITGNTSIETPDADPRFLYQNVLVALDADAGINNGEPFLHARWLGLVAPQPGELVTHIGTGTGYYTAILSMLVRPEGRVTGFEIHEGLARMARACLAPFDNVTVVAGDAVALDLPPADLIYVNAGVIAPPGGWLRALRPRGRMILPWRPSIDVGLTIVVTRTDAGYAVSPRISSWFIPCVGASGPPGRLTPDHDAAMRSRSIHLIEETAPDATATAIYDRVWFSSAPVGL